MFAQIYSNRTAVMPFGRLLMVCLKRVSPDWLVLLFLFFVIELEEGRVPLSAQKQTVFSSVLLFASL